MMAPKVLRRPGGGIAVPARHPRGGEEVLRRPASRLEETVEDEPGGMWRSIRELSLEEIGRLDKLIIEGKYWEAPCMVAGVVTSEEAIAG